VGKIFLNHHREAIAAASLLTFSKPANPLHFALERFEFVSTGQFTISRAFYRSEE